MHSECSKGSKNRVQHNKVVYQKEDLCQAYQENGVMFLLGAGRDIWD